MRIFEGFDRGIITALITPLTRDLEVKIDVLEDLVEFQLKNGVKGFFALGTYGEGIALHPRKRKFFTEALREVLPSSVPLIVNVSTPSLELSLELALHARDVGCSAIASLPPLYYKPDTAGILRFFDHLSKADIPLLVYNNPAKQGYDLPLTVFDALVKAVPAVRGIKDSSGSLERLQLLVRSYSSECFIAAARDSFILQAFLLGADAHICGLCNAFPEIAAVFGRVASGNLHLSAGIKLQLLITTLRDAVKKFNVESPAIVKELLRLRGIDVGVPMPPMRPLEANEVEALKKKILPIMEELQELLGKNLLSPR